jgi:hypothetical protein
MKRLLLLICATSTVLGSGCRTSDGWGISLPGLEKKTDRWSDQGDLTERAWRDQERSTGFYRPERQDWPENN